MLRNQRFPVGVLLVTMRRGVLVAVIARLMSNVSVKWVEVVERSYGLRKPLNLHIFKIFFFFRILLRPLLVMHTQNFDVFGQVIMT